MKIDLTKIEGYENMTAEEKIAALEGFDVQQDYTGYVRKDLLDKANSEAADYKRQLRAAMSEAEKKAADDEETRKAMEERLKQLETEKEYADRKAQFIGVGFTEEQASNAAKAMVEGDMNKVFEIQKSVYDGMKASIKAEILRDTPKPPPGDGKKDITKKEFSGLSLDEKQAMYVSDPDKYKNLTEG